MILRGKAVVGDRTIDDAVVVTERDRISWVGAADEYRGPSPLPQPTSSILLPGLIDLHCHGGGGTEFSSSDAAGARHAINHHRGQGTTSQLGSLVSAREPVLLRQAEILAGLVESGELLGIHLEGPFLSRARCGAQDPDAIVPGDPGLFERVCDAARGTVRSMTLAPETAHFGKLLTVMRRRGVIPSLGHTDADAATTSARIADAAGQPVVATHLFNAMPPLHHRAPGAAGACLAAAGRGDMIVELIADGTHLAPETVSMVFDTVDPDQIVLVSDAMVAAGMADGDYHLGPLDVRVTQGVARLATSDGSEGAIAASTARLLDVVRSTVVDSGVDLGIAVASASRVPARLLGLEFERGTLAPNHRADIVVTDHQLRLRGVVVGGMPVGEEGVAWNS
ncbi:N-acetylglucosamine-6-phosphate deacetylase [Rhodococcus sp. WMMA185]|uniref:N-acetylglucosamine-6-phosphate deacetylase n=1 Tax=Rhodococcus sp. WMMA185 TaxID=679318 RepID=UPI000877FDDD|nr:amidohydrolase family protein [Rhodococcus sp. WMMA185]AOW93066.1 N-acetylglucosamine-6-phosphate deacetylase [Rhodococcus sp. WMMA185]